MSAPEMYICVYCDRIMTEGYCKPCHEIDGAATFDEWIEQLEDWAATMPLVRLLDKVAKADAAYAALRALGPGACTADEYDVVADKACTFSRALRNRLAEIDKAAA